MKDIKITTQTGEAHILLEHTIGIVRRESKEHSHWFDVDIHMISGTIFTMIDCNEADFGALLEAWEMFKDRGVLSPAYLKDGEVVER